MSDRDADLTIELLDSLLYSSPHTRATRTLGIAWDVITLPNKKDHVSLYLSHGVVIAKVTHRITESQTLSNPLSTGMELSSNL